VTYHYKIMQLTSGTYVFIRDPFDETSKRPVYAEDGQHYLSVCRVDRPTPGFLDAFHNQEYITNEQWESLWSVFESDL
jgi:hypothetical protein